MEVNQTTYETMKREVSGFYHKFNQQVLRWHMSKIFNYEDLLESAKGFDNFSEFFNFHTSKKENIINKHIKQMYNEANSKGLNPTEDLVKKCLIVRLGNVYNGMFTENKILTVFNTLAPYISCTKTDKDIDTYYKVDGIIELIGIDRLAIQIKPSSFLKYDNGSELQYHSLFEKEFGTKVYYVLYKNKNEVLFNGNSIKLNEPEKIIEQIEKLLIYS